MPKNKKNKNNKNKIYDREDMLDNMYKRYGTQVLYVEVNVHMIASEVEEYFGRRCDEYERGCATCEAWDQWNRTGTTKVLLYRDVIIKMINN